MLNKETLLKYKFVTNNTYLDKYVELINHNIYTKKEKFKTQNHHVIPVHFYYSSDSDWTQRAKMTKLAEADPNNFKVNLLYKDHVLAHYYLALCTTGKVKYANENAIFHVLGNANYVKDNNYVEECAFIKALDQYQELYEDMAKTRSKNYTGRHCQPNTELHKQQISAKNKGAKYIRRLVNNAWEVRKVHSIEELNNYLNMGWEIGTYPMDYRKNHKSEDSIKERQSQKRKNAIYITNGLDNKIIYPENFNLLEDYYSKGWVRGRTVNTENMKNDYNNRKDRIKINNGVEAKLMKKDLAYEFLKNNPTWKVGGLLGKTSKQNFIFHGYKFQGCTELFNYLCNQNLILENWDAQQFSGMMRYVLNNLKNNHKSKVFLIHPWLKNILDDLTVIDR